MNFCFNSRPAIQRFFLGVSTGAVATIVIGFASGGWILGTTARRLAEKSSSSAVVAALAPIRVDQFQQALTAATNLVELRKNLQPAAFVQKGGWSSMPGGKTADEPAVAGACVRHCSWRRLLRKNLAWKIVRMVERTGIDSPQGGTSGPLSKPLTSSRPGLRVQ